MPNRIARRRRGGLNRYVRAAGTVARVAANAYSAYKRARTAPSTADNSDPVTTTSHNDNRVLYRSKKMGRTGRARLRSYLKWGRKINSVATLSKPLQKVLFTEKGTTFATLAGGQNMHMGQLQLYGTESASPGLRDLFQITSTLPFTGATKWYFQNAHMEISITNKGDFPCYVEAYYYIARRNALPASVGCFNTLVCDTTNMGGTTPALTTYGVTPFDCHKFTEHFKVYKKTVTLLPATGANMDIVLTSGGNWWYDTDTTLADATVPGRTKGILLCYYGVAQTADGNAGIAQLAYNVTRTYNVKSNSYGDSGNTVLAA